MSGVTSVSTVGHEHAVVVELAAGGDVGAPGRPPRRSTPSTRSRSAVEISAETSVASSSGSPTTSDETSVDERRR